MSQDELLAHIETKLSVLDRPLLFMKWLVAGGFFIGAWATAQQMTLTALVEWKKDKNTTDVRQDGDIRSLERDVLSKLHAVSTQVGKARSSIVNQIKNPDE